MKLEPGQLFTVSYGEKTEEGYLYEERTFFFDADLDIVTESVYSRQRDCDGTYEDSASWDCGCERLESREVEFFHDSDDKIETVMMPQWERRTEDEWRRDHTAESMNY